MPRVSTLSSRKILNSRDEWTIEVALTTDNGLSVVASVPQGKSSGKYEVINLPADRAVLNINEIIAPQIIGESFGQQKKIDQKLIQLDGTSDKSELGGNAILGVSLAYARAGAKVKNEPLWQYIRNLSGLNGEVTSFPRLYVNVINGGLHVSGGPKFQEYMIIPRSREVRKAVEVASKIYHALGDYLSQNISAGAARVGDEGGYTIDGDDDLKPWVVLGEVIKGIGIKEEVDYGLDAAASNVDLNVADLRSLYKEMKERFDLFYLEDPFDENDFVSFASLKKDLGDKLLLTGDDLTVTNVDLINKAYNEDAVNAVIIKPNQVGTLTETLAAVKRAHELNWSVVVSHRSGETNDDFIADLAYGVAADGFKLGAPARGERVAKYNRLLDIDNNLKLKNTSF